MDSVLGLRRHLTGRQRRRALKYGFPNAVRLFVLFAVFVFTLGVLCGKAFAIGTVNASFSATTVPANWCVGSVKGVSSGNTAANDCTGSTGPAGKFGSEAAAVSAAITKGMDMWAAINPTYPYIACNRTTTSYPANQSSGNVDCTYSPGGAGPFHDGWAFLAFPMCDIDPSTSTRPTATGSVTTYTCATHTMTCPTGSTAVGSTCVCNAGSRAGLSTTTCSAYSCAGGTDASINNYQYPAGTAVPSTGYFCNTRAGTQTEGCQIAFTPTIKAVDATTGNTFVWGSSMATGGKCEGGGVGVGTSPTLPTTATTAASGVSTSTTNAGGVPNSATTCAEGKIPTTVGGTTTCVTANGTVSSIDSTAQTTTPAGAASAPAGVAAGTVTTETQCSNGACREVTTTYDAAGNVIAVNAGGSASQADYCKSHTSSQQCGGTGGGGGGGSGSSTYGGSCAATTCSDSMDAVVCAIWQEQMKRNCQIEGAFGDGTTTNAQTTAGTAAVAAGDDGASDHPHRSGNIPSTALSFDTTNLLSGSCPGDRTISAGSVSVVLPFSHLCSAAGTLGALLQGITALACLGIVFLRGN